MNVFPIWIDKLSNEIFLYPQHVKMLNHDLLREIQNTIGNIQKIKHIDKETNDFLSCLSYKCIRLLYEIESRIYEIFYLGPKEISVFHDYRTCLLKAFDAIRLKEKTIGETCGLEFLRFKRNEMLSEQFQIQGEMKQFMIKPTKELINNYMITKNVKDLLLDNSNGNDKKLQEYFANANKISLSLLFSDCIRFIYANDDLDLNKKMELIKKLINCTKKSICLFDDLDMCLSMSLSVLFHPKNNNPNNNDIQCFFNFIDEYSNSYGEKIVDFIEKFAKDDEIIKYGILNSISALKIKNPFKNIKIETLDSCVNEVLSKMRWTPSKSFEYAQNLEKSISSKITFSKFSFLEENEDIKLIVEKNNIDILTAISSKHLNFMKYMIFYIEEKNIKTLIQVFNKMLELENIEKIGDNIFAALANVLPLRPYLIKQIIPIIKKIPSQCDSSPFIRFMSYNCTSDEICEIYDNVIVFPSNEQHVKSLFKDSIRWRKLPLSMFWFIVNCVLDSQCYDNVIIYRAIGNVLLIIDDNNNSVYKEFIILLLHKYLPSEQMKDLLDAVFRKQIIDLDTKKEIIDNWMLLNSNSTNAFLKANSIDIYNK